MESAQRLFTRSLQIDEALANASPNSSLAKRDLPYSYIKLGDVYRKLGATDKALEFFQKYHELTESLASADPNSSLAKLDLSISYNRLGDMHLTLDADKALQFYQKGLELAEALAKAHPNNARGNAQTCLPRTTTSPTHICSGVGTARPFKFHLKSLTALDESLAKADPNNAQAKRDLSVSYKRSLGTCIRSSAPPTKRGSFTRRISN